MGLSWGNWLLKLLLVTEDNSQRTLSASLLLLISQPDEVFVPIVPQASRRRLRRSWSLLWLEEQLSLEIIELAV